MRLPHAMLALVLCAVVSSGCDREDPTPAAVPAPTRPAAADIPPAAPPSATLPVSNTPEDLTVDPERDPRIRERAGELNAVAVAEMRSFRAGDEAIVLVRGDRGGGTIYGSGPYTADSQLRKAVVHHGALKHRELGLVRVKFLKHEGEHPSVPANGIVPTKWGKYHTSYVIEKVEGA